MPEPIELGGNSYEYSFLLNQIDDTTGKKELAEGVAGVSVWLSDTDNGATINAALTKAAVERVGAPGAYWVTWDGTDLNTYLAGKTKVWIVVSHASDVKRSTPVRVR